MQSSKQVVTIGGGTGTFTVLSGLKKIPGVSLTAIVSSADNGGSTGRLRDAYGILPVGDARQALVALASDESELRDLFTYRFSKGDVAGHNLGNLFITALADRLGSATAALAAASTILRIEGRVLSVSEQATEIVATLADGSRLAGEHAIDVRVPGRSCIEELSLARATRGTEPALEAIREADLLVLGPGDLYSSTTAPLLPDGVAGAIRASAGKLVYVMNLFTKAGQTDGLAASAHVAIVERYARRPIDHILISTDTFNASALARYRAEGEEPVTDDLQEDARVLRRSLASVSFVEPVPEDPVPRSLIRHDSDKLASALTELMAS